MSKLFVFRLRFFIVTIIFIIVRVLWSTLDLCGGDIPPQNWFACKLKFSYWFKMDGFATAPFKLQTSIYTTMIKKQEDIKIFQTRPILSLFIANWYVLCLLEELFCTRTSVELSVVPDMSTQHRRVEEHISRLGYCNKIFLKFCLQYVFKQEAIVANSHHPLLPNFVKRLRKKNPCAFRLVALVTIPIFDKHFSVTEIGCRSSEALKIIKRWNDSVDK